MTSLSTRLRRLADDYAEALRGLFRERLVSVVLFGSVARGEATPYSDIDLLIVVDGLPKGRIARLDSIRRVDRRVQARLRGLRSGGIHGDVCPILKSPEEAARVRPLYLDMVEDAVILYDRDRFFAGVLGRLRKRLRELGSVRRRMGKIRYWELKPDYRPGEVFEL
jgi:hypothetical protein